MPDFTRADLGEVSRCRVPRVLTPRASSAGRAFTIEHSASDVLCRRMGTVAETSGSRHRLAKPEQLLALTSNGSRARIDPYGQNRASAERFKNSAAHDSERLTSYREPTSVTPWIAAVRPVVHARQKATRTRSLNLSPRPLVKECLGSHRARPPLNPRVPFGATRWWTKIRPTDICNLTCQKRAPALRAATHVLDEVSLGARR